MKYRDYKVEVLKYLISYFRPNEDIKNILLAIGMRFNELQDIIIQLLDSLTISKAKGFLLDNIGAEVGTTRDEVDYGDYFCVNLPHLNVAKRFYFLASNLDPNQKVTLKDGSLLEVEKGSSVLDVAKKIKDTSQFSFFSSKEVSSSIATTISLSCSAVCNSCCIN